MVHIFLIDAGRRDALTRRLLGVRGDTGRSASMDEVRKSHAAEAFSSVSREDVQRALNDLDRGVEHPFGPSSTYDLVYEGRRYPPKAVIALAAKTRSGINLVPADFPGGEGTAAFDTLRRLGFEIVPKEISTGGPVKFERLDCEIFDRYRLEGRWFYRSSCHNNFKTPTPPGAPAGIPPRSETHGKAAPKQAKPS
jgi:hypothetical protein